MQFNNSGKGGIMSNNFETKKQLSDYLGRTSNKILFFLFITLTLFTFSSGVLSGDEAQGTNQSTPQKESVKSDGGIEIDGLNYKEMRITTDEAFKYIELKHSDGVKAYIISEFPSFNVRMKDGTLVEKAKLTEINPAGITVMFSKGVKGLKFADMNDASQIFFGYDAKRAEDYLNKISQAQAERMKDIAIQKKADAEKQKIDAKTYKEEVENNNKDLGKQSQLTESTNKSSSKGTSCSRCKGSGMIGAGPPGPMFWSKTKPCPYCNGTGKVNR